MSVALGVTSVLLVATIATGSDSLLSATQWAYAAGGASLMAATLVEARDSRRAWAAVTQPAFDYGLLGDEPDVIIRKRSIFGRLLYLALGVPFLTLAINVALDSGFSNTFKLLWVPALLATGAFVASFAFAALVARRDLVAVRSSIRWRTAAWSEVEAVEPTHYGITFELKDGRRLVAIVTSKSTLTFLPVRYDKALVAELRSRIH